MARRGAARPVDRKAGHRSLDELSESAPKSDAGEPQPSPPPALVEPVRRVPIDLSASARALEERQLRWIRLREPWVRKERAAAPRATTAPKSADDEAEPNPGT